MPTTVWILHGAVAFIFLFSGLHKAYFDERTLVEKGQTGVEGLSPGLIKFIGVAEILGATALILPALIDKFLFLIPVAAFCLGLIMLPAAVIHYRRAEPRNVLINVVILAVCITIAGFWLA